MARIRVEGWWGDSGGWGDGGGWGDEGQVGSRRRSKATIKTQTAVVCVQQVAQTATIHRTGRDSR